MADFGTAPRKIGGVWTTRSGRRLSPAGQRYWERHYQAGAVDIYGHVNREQARDLRTAQQAQSRAQQALGTKGFLAASAEARRGTQAGQRMGARAQAQQEKLMAQGKTGLSIISMGATDVAEAVGKDIAGVVKHPTRHHRSATVNLANEWGVQPVKKAVEHPSPRTIVLGALGAMSIAPFGPARGAARALKAGEEAARAAKVGTEVEKAARAGEVIPAPSPEAQRVAKAFAEEAPSIRAAQDVRRRQEFGRRISKRDEAFDVAGGGREGHYAALREMKGEYEKIPFNALHDFPTKKLGELHNEIQDLPHLLDGEKMRLGIAIENAAQHKIVPQPNEVALMHKAFGAEAAAQFANHGKRPWEEVIPNILNIPRAVMASGDLSAPFRQGLMAFAMNPVVASKQLPKMFRDFVSEAHYQKGIGDIHADPDYENFIAAGGSMTELGPRAAQREEAFGSKAAEGISPGLLVGKPGRGGSIVRASGRAYTGFLDRLRLELYKTLKAQAQTKNLELGRVKGAKRTMTGQPVSSTLDEDLAAVVNWATGRGTFRSKKLEGMAPVLNSVFFSPRLFKSRLDAVNPGFYSRLDPFARKKALGGLTNLVATGVGVLTLAKQLGGVDVELDPRSSDWGKIRIGKNRYDVWGGYQQIARTVAQQIYTPHNGEWGQWQKSSTTGEFSHPKHTFDPAWNLVQNKFSPPISLAKDIHEKEMFGHKPVTLWNEAKEKGQPILWHDIYTAGRQRDWTNLGLTAGLGTFGVGAQRYSSQKPKTPRHPGTGRFINPRNLPPLSDVAHRQGHGGPNLPSLAEMAHRHGH